MQLATDPIELKCQLKHLVEVSERTLIRLTSPVVVFNPQVEFWTKDYKMWGTNKTLMDYKPPTTRFARFSNYNSAYEGD